MDNSKEVINLVEALVNGKATLPGFSGSDIAAELTAVFPDYNLDSDRGYAWPSWEVDPKFPTKLNPSDPANMPRRFAIVKASPWNDNDTGQ